MIDDGFECDTCVLVHHRYVDARRPPGEKPYAVVPILETDPKTGSELIRFTKVCAGCATIDVDLFPTKAGLDAVIDRLTEPPRREPVQVVRVSRKKRGKK